MRYPESESTTLEFKQQLPQNEKIIRTVIGFCNQFGGRLIIGIADDRNIKGLAESEIEFALETIDKTLYEACTPPILPRMYIQRMGDKSLLVIEIFEGMSKPYYRRSEGPEKGTYIRLGRHTLRATPELIQELRWRSQGVQFESLPVHGASIADLSWDAIYSFLKNRNKNIKKNTFHAKTIDAATEQILRSYHIITFDQLKRYPTTLGILLFGRSPQLYFSEAMIICSHFKGVIGREVIATVDCEGALFDQLKQAFSFILSRLSRAFIIKKIKREEILEIPETAIREALLNAIIHRNYHIKAPIKIAIYDDRVEFFSPGQFPGPLDVNHLERGITYLRNPMLCKVFREAQYIEKLGSGLIEIFNSYRERHLSTPYFIEGENFIKCVLPRISGKQAKDTSFTITDKVLRLFDTMSDITVRDVIRECSLSRATAVRRLNEMIHLGLIERMGTKKSIRYKLKNL